MTMTYQFALAQLRHAYSQLHAGTVKDQRQFAEGLLGPAIEALERGIEQNAPLGERLITAAKNARDALKDR